MRLCVCVYVVLSGYTENVYTKRSALPMTGQGAAVAETFGAAVKLACVRPLARMGAQVDGQGGSLRAGFSKGRQTISKRGGRLPSERTWMKRLPHHGTSHRNGLAVVCVGKPGFHMARALPVVGVYAVVACGVRWAA